MWPRCKRSLVSNNWCLVWTGSAFPQSFLKCKQSDAERKDFVDIPKEGNSWFYTSLLRFSQTCELWSSKAAFAIAFFAAVNHNYDHKQWTLKHRNTQNGSKSTNHKSQTLTFWSRQSKVLLPKRSVKMIDSSEKRNRHLSFELRYSHVCEKHSKRILSKMNSIYSGTSI